MLPQGFDEFGFATQGLLLAATTFSADVLSGLALPAVVSACSGSFDSAAAARAAARARVLWATAAMASAPVATAAFAAAALRRDLHVWELFAPRLCFDTGGALVLAVAAGVAAAVRRGRL